MKKFFLIIIITFFFSSTSFGQIIYLLCRKNSDLFPIGEFHPVKVDFENNEMVLDYEKFKMIEKDNYLIFENNEIKDNTKLLKLNRLTLHLEVKSYKNEQIDTKHSYETFCNIVERKI